MAELSKSLRSTIGPRCVALLVVIAIALVRCTTGSPGSPTAPTLGGDCHVPPPPQVEINGVFYEPLWGPVRSDITQMNAISSTTLKAEDNRKCPFNVPDNVNQISGVPIDQMFVEIRDASNMNGGNASTPLACHHPYEAYVFTAVGSEESPSPFSRPTATPSSGTTPTPTPPPAPPTNGPLVELSSQGLLDAGSPYIYLQAPDGRYVSWDSGIRIMYKGREYHFSNNRPLDDHSSLRIPLDDLVPIELIRVQYVEDRWPIGLAKALPFLLKSGEAEDWVRIYRPKDRSAEDVIVVDPCPTYPDDLQPNNLVFWGRIEPDPAGK